MVLSVLLLALTFGIAYFHYTQGLFSATISAILATIAAAVAVGYHENVAAWMVGGKFTEEADALALCAIFGVVYLVPRVIFDLAIPGNVRFPVLVDKIGAGVMGIWAGLIATGVLAIAAQTLPFGPDVGYYARYTINDTTGQYMGMGVQQDVTMYDVTKSPTLNPDDENHLLLHQDDLVLGLVAKLSDGGSLAGSQPLAAVHPDYLAELFGQRIGIQVGARHTLVGAPMPVVSVAGVYFQPQLVQIDGEIQSLRPTDEQVQQVLQPTDQTQQALLIVRMVVDPSPDATDSDMLFRFSAGSIRLVAGSTGDAGADYVDYHPVATLDRRGIAVACRVDDFLFAPLDGPRTIDLVFMVDRDRVFGPGSKDPPYRLAPGTFLEVKRYSTVDLSDKKVEYGPPINRDKMGVLRKTDVQKALLALGAQQLTGVLPPQPPQAGVTTGDLGLDYEDISDSYALFAPIDVRKPDANGSVQLPNGVSGIWQNRRFGTLSIPIAVPVSVASAPGTNTINQFSPIEENNQLTLVQVHLLAPKGVSGRKAWDWGKHVNDLTLADTQDMTYKPIGVWVRAVAKEEDYIVASYANNGNSFYPINAQASKTKPVDVWIGFMVPPGTKLQEMRLADTAVLEDLGYTVQVPVTTQTTQNSVSSPPAGSGAGSQ